MAPATTRVEIDSELLARLRARHPAKDDRALIEDLARVDLGFNALRVAQQRNALAEPDAADLAVHALRESRRTAG
jgi:hypothetical protein